MARLLNTYQLWLDDLFPKAKFADGLTMIEKLGHKKRIQIMRKEWINEGKPKPVDDDEDVDAFIEQITNNERSKDQEHASLQVEDSRNNQNATAEIAHAADSNRPTQNNEQGQEEPDEDELDALFAEEMDTAPRSLFGGPTTTNNEPVQPHHDDFEDDEEAMAGMDW